jgi:hypothetical protein
LFLIDAHLNVQKFITTLEHALAHVWYTHYALFYVKSNNSMKIQFLVFLEITCRVC